MRRHLFAQTALISLSSLALGAGHALAQASVNDQLQAQQTAGASTTDATAAPDTSNQLSEVVVTAQRRVENVQRTPISISTVDGATVRQEARTTIDDVLKDVPGVQIQGQAKGLVVDIRGLSTNLPPGSGDNAIAVNLDGVYNIRSESGEAGFYDLSRVEVLRGPQATLYGRSATGGVVNVVSTNPVIGDFGGYATVGVGNYGLYRGEAAVNIPISDKFAARLAINSINRDGYLSDGSDDADVKAARLKLLFKPSEGVSLLLGGEVQHLGGQGLGMVPSFVTPPGDPYVSTSRDPSIIPTGEQSLSYTYYKLWAQLDWDLGPAVLTFLPAYQNAKGDYRGYVGGSLSDGGDPSSLPQTSVEVRLASAASSAIKWVAGYYFYDEDQYSFAGALDLQTTVTHEDKAKSQAVFGQVTIPLTSALRVTGGARETWDIRQTYYYEPSGFLPGNGGAGRVSGSHFDYRAALEYDVAPTVMAYASVSSGYRSGGLAQPTSFVTVLNTYKAETLTSYEAGVKSRFWDNRLQINGDVYYYDYKNFQASDYYFTMAGPVLSFANAPKVRSYGAELEVQALLTEHDTIGANAAFLDAHYKGSFFLHLDPANLVDENGLVLPHAPRWQIAANYQHTFELGDFGALTARVDVRHTSDAFVQAVQSGVSLQPAYWNEDVSLRYAPAHARWTIAAYVKNLSDEVVKTGNFGPYLTLAPPRTYGGSIMINF